MPALPGSQLPPPSEVVLSAKEVARILGITRRTLWRWLSTGNLPEPLRLSSRTLRWRKADIDSFLTSRHS